MGKSKFRVVFLILHYHSMIDTQKAIESIIENTRNCHFENYSIIVVDNGSKNYSGKKLKENYEKNKKVIVLLNEKNLGFAAGNNIGFEYIKKNEKADFVIMMNNDVVIVQDDFLSEIFKEYEKSHFVVLGPRIDLPPGNISYHRDYLAPIWRYRYEIFKLRVKWFLNFIDKNELLRDLKHRIIAEKDTDTTEKKCLERREDVILHGSCLIFSKEFIEMFGGLEERTFLYGEEEFLYIRMMMHEMRMVYNPNIFVFHNEDATTESITKNKRGKILFTSKYGIKARKEIIREIKKYNKYKKEKNEAKRNK